MIWNTENAKIVADKLLQIKAIKLQPNQPFTWASGWKSPIYCDNRLSLSYPEIRSYVVESLAKGIEEKYGEFDVVAGVATGAIAVGALVADKLNKPFVYVRSSAKAHGRQNKVEGALEAGQKVVVVEDLISTGMSSLDAVAALREMNAEVIGMAAIFSYGFDVANDNFVNANCTLFTLSNYDALVENAADTGYIDQDSLSLLKEWRANPSQWGK
ncbi:MAG: orotate phosphoribosyltransferase [Schleiferiaceae bacterium]|jgi:orotate phosphoribosyltransferase|nr:orotate phosphoribosyltransferase [Schleiferiaceae bacterium]